MYQPAHFEETRPEELLGIVRAHPLGLLVTHTGAGLDANHVPFLVDDALTALRAHVARANPLWTQVPDGAEVLVVFRGAQGYISPNWYESKAEHHRHVPTWNYEAVHAHGRLRIRDDLKYVRSVVAHLTRTHEAALPKPWKMGDAPPDYLDETLRHIVGIEVEVTRWEGKRKLSQNRDARDFESTLRALEERGQAELVDAMKRASP